VSERDNFVFAADLSLCGTECESMNLAKTTTKKKNKCRNGKKLNLKILMLEKKIIIGFPNIK
jgi:hypothetical protein